MPRWLKRTIVMLAAVTTLSYAVGTVDAFLFRYRARKLFRSVEQVSLGTPVKQLEWMQVSYPSRSATDGYESRVALDASLTALDFQTRFGEISILPRNLVMRPTWARASLGTAHHRIISRSVVLLTNFDRTGFAAKYADVLDPDIYDRVPSLRALYSESQYPGYALRQRLPRGMEVLNGLNPQWATVAITPGATEDERRAAYDLNFRCLWRWNRCDSATDLLSPELLNPTKRR